MPKAGPKRLAKGLGWFSVGLGLTELLAPQAIARISGVSNKHTGLIRLYGLREIASGISIFSQKEPATGVWSRGAGDALDLASLGMAFTSPNVKGGAETINYEEQNVYEVLMDMTGGRGPDACIDDVGMEAHAPGLVFAYDRMKQAMALETDRPHALREAIMFCRNGGIISVNGVYGGFIDKFPIGSVMHGRSRSGLDRHTYNATCGPCCS